MLIDKSNSIPLLWGGVLREPTNGSLEQIEEKAGEQGLISRSSVINIVHQEGERLQEAVKKRAADILKANHQASCQLGNVADKTANKIAVVELQEDDFQQQEGEEVELIPFGFAGTSLNLDMVAKHDGRIVDPGWVIVEADEVKVKAQSSTEQKELWVFTAMVMTNMRRFYFTANSTAELRGQVAALLYLLGVDKAKYQLLFIADGAKWVRSWFEAIGIKSKAMILCWYHLVKRCQQLLIVACRNQEERKKLQAKVVAHLWEGRVEDAMAVLCGERARVRNLKALESLIDYISSRSQYIPNYKLRQEAGLWIASNRIEKFNDWSISNRCKHKGMEWTSHGVGALAALETARLNCEIPRWRKTGRLPKFQVEAKLEMAA